MLDFFGSDLLSSNSMLLGAITTVALQKVLILLEYFQDKSAIKLLNTFIKKKSVKLN